jgi:hypothetical protein
MVLFVYVDNSNVWIEGRRASAVAKGLAPSFQEAMDQKIVDPHWTYDFGRLYELACPSGEQIGRSLLLGSRPPENDSLWQRAREAAFEVEVYDRNVANKEKQVDTGLATRLVADSYEHMQSRVPDVMAVLVAGDGDYVPPIKDLQRRGIRVRVVFWRHAVSRELREAADEFEDLGPHLDFLSLA